MTTDTPSDPVHMFTITTDRANALYDAGDTVVFRIEADGDVSTLPEYLEYFITWDGAALIDRGAVRARDLPQEVTVRPDGPGFVRLCIETGQAGSGAPKVQAAAAVAPERIGPSLPVPDDFDEFWDEQLASQWSSSIEADLTHYADHMDGMVSSVVIRMPDEGDIYGWLLRPHGPGPFPGLVRYHGAGVYPVEPTNGLDWTARGVMVLSINPHPIPNDCPKEFYDKLRGGALADYRTRGRADRETLYFREMFLRAARAVDFVAGHEDWDGRHLIVEGHSQGGGQALAAAALNEKVSAIVVSCSTHCDHTGPVIGRVAGWPKIVEVRDGVPDPTQVTAARYIDGVNFASRISCPAMFSLGFLDDLCPPTGIYAAYNALHGRKEIRHDISVGHIHTDACKAATYKWVTLYLARNNI